MKVLILTPYMSGNGGTETVMTNLFSAYNEDQNSFMDLQLISIGGTKHREWLQGTNAKIIPLPFAEHKKILILDYLIFLPFIIAKMVVSRDVDVIVSTNPIMWGISKICTKFFRKNIKIIAWYHYSLLSKPIKKFWLNKADYFWAISSGIVNQLIKQGINRDRIKLVYNPILRQGNILPRSEITKNFVYIGRIMMDGQKNLRELLNAFSEVNGDWLLHIFGDGKDLDKLKRYADSLRIEKKVIWHGFNKKPWDCLKSADALILTSKYEGLPMVLGEAASRGVYMISADIDTGPNDFIKNGVNGELYHLGDIDELSNKVQRVVDGAKLPDQKKIVQSVNKFYKEKLLSKFEAVSKRNYRSLVKFGENDMDSKPKIAVLLSTYNGEEYLGQQITSIIDQSYDNWVLMVRDDGSQDQTVEILRQFEKKDQRIRFINKEKVVNKGVKSSFIDLLAFSDADYYMFCDQDDFWLKDKIVLTLDTMQGNEKKDEPRLIHTELKVVDNNLKPVGLMYNTDFHDEFCDVLYSNSVTGCTMMLNNALKNMILNKQIEADQIVMHDWWFALIASAFGSIEFMREPTILYRQHGDNTFGAQISRFQRIKRLLSMNLEIERFKLALKQDLYFERVYGESLEPQKKKILSGATSLLKSRNGLAAFVSMLSSKARKTTLKGTLLMWYVVLFKHRFLIDKKRIINMEKIGVGVVLYNPDIDRLKRNITSLLKQNNNILLFDNGSDNLNEVEGLYKNNFKITIQGFSKNRGIATALNGIMKYFYEHGFDWVLTMDQDSLPPENMLIGYVPYVKQQKVAIISPTIWDLSEKLEDVDRSNNKFDIVNQAITSGSLTKISIWRQVDGFDENMFIDLVDFDFCLRVNLAGNRIIRVNSVILRQEIGQTKQKYILGRRIPVDNHSLFRKYYQARNHIYYFKKFGKLSDRNMVWDESKLFIKTVLFEDHKIKKIMTILHGIIDGIKMSVNKIKRI